MTQRNYCLVGPMGAGKSTIGRLLAKELRLTFKDSDKEIEERTGATIPLIFDLEGEQGFRDREEQAISDLVRESGLVLATGGGAVMRESNRQVIKRHCRVIYLHTSVDNQLERTAKDRNRPLLQTDNPRQVLEQLLALRDPLYRSIADIIVETDIRPPRTVIREIMRQISLMPN